MRWCGVAVASKALMQMLQETWRIVWCLMPPGTVFNWWQNIPVTGAVVVPQDIALIDAKKGIVMFESRGSRCSVSKHDVHICSSHMNRFSIPVVQKLAGHTLPGQMEYISPVGISIKRQRLSAVLRRIYTASWLTRAARSAAVKSFRQI